MRPAILLTVCLWLAAGPAAQPVARRTEPFVRVAVSYPIALFRDADRAKADLEAIHALGFNAVEVAVDWADTEPARGKYQLDALDRALELAGSAGLQVILRVETASLPSWLLRRYPDGRFTPSPAGDRPRPERACLDHPGVRADVEAYVGAVSTRAARHASWQAVDVGSDLENGFCTCPHTTRRFRDWVKATSGATARPADVTVSDRAAFVALERRDHLALIAAAAAARDARTLSSRARAPSVIRQVLAEPAGQDDWLMTTVVDQYGTHVPPRFSRDVTLEPAQLAFALDGLRSAARDRGWLMTGRVGATPATPISPAADLRFWTWLGVSRGARGVTYSDWRVAGPGHDAGLVQADGTISEGARAAGALARVIGRNPALFAPLRPRPARIAIAYDPRPPSRAASQSDFPSGVHRALFERNIQVDFIHFDEIAAGMASRYNVVCLGSAAALPKPAADALKGYAAAGGVVITGSTPSLTDQEIVSIAARAGVTPEVRIEGATGPVETRYLESPDVLMIVGLNHSGQAQRVKMTFTPDTQEAIWQNMETGAAVNFIAGPDGPVYTYSFAPRDALILMIRKSLR